jgi:hypothetical protein
LGGSELWGEEMYFWRVFERGLGWWVQVQFQVAGRFLIQCRTSLFCCSNGV